MNEYSINLQIANLRKKKGVTQDQLAKHLGVSFQAVSKWETGSAYPDITLLPKIADYFNESIDTILGVHPVIKEPRDIYITIKEYLSSLNKEELYHAAWNISAVIHEGLCSNGWKGYVNWETKNRLEDDSYKGWGLSINAEPEGFTHMTSGFTIIGSTSDITLPKPEDAINICRFLDKFTNKTFMNICLKWNNCVKTGGKNKPYSIDELCEMTNLKDTVLKDFIDQMLDMNIITEVFSPDLSNTQYQLNKGWIVLPLIIISDLLSNKLKNG